jgi:hypothetical protein
VTLHRSSRKLDPDRNNTTGIVSTIQKKGLAAEQKVRQLRELFPDAPERGKKGGGERAPGADVAGI